MSHENLNSTVSNFCRSPVVGSWCSVVTTDPVNPALVTKNESGGLVDSHFILGGIDFDGLLTIEYVGPTDLSYFYDGLDFIALERVSDSICIIKFMEINTTFKTLNLREEIVYRDFAEYGFDAKSMAVEYYETTIKIDTPANRNYIEVDDISKLAKGMRLFLGPSTDPDSYNMCEVVYISSIVPLNNRVHLTSFLTNEYVIGNRISFYKYIYLISNKGVVGDTINGSIIKIDPITKYIVNYHTDPIYKKLTLAKWCPYLRKVALLYTCNILYSDPYDYYTISRSQFLGNFNASKSNFYTINDIVFRDTGLYKLSNEITIKDVEGRYLTVAWGSKYNYQRDTLIPYVANITIYASDFYTIDNYGTTTINFKVSDQFGVGLRDVPLQATLFDGDINAMTTPLSGQMTTDINGLSNIIYTAGVGNYNGITYLQALTYEGSPYTGSNVVVGESFITSTACSLDNRGRLFTVLKFSSVNTNAVKQVVKLFSYVYIRAFSFFSSQGGNWIPPVPESFGNTRARFDLLSFYGSYLGERQGLKRDVDNQNDIGAGLTIDLKPKLPGITPLLYTENNFSISNRITASKEYVSVKSIIDISSYFKIYPGGIQGSVGPFVNLSQRAKMNYSTSLSQLFHSRHSHWMDGIYQKYLTTNVRLNQFIFVQDAIPPFWSRKNPTDTDVWLRLRPFAASLDASTVVMRVRQTSHIEDTGYIDISNLIVTTGFDAGGGLLGVEVLYDPIENFYHNAIVYIYLSIRDVIGNLIKIEYWFTIIRDYLGPYLNNLIPDVNQIQVAETTTISFDVLDGGTGVDITTFEMNVNSLIVYPQVINKVTTKYYRIEYTPPKPFLNNSEVMVSVHVADRASVPNWLHYGYRFYIQESAAVLLTGFTPEKCTYGVSKFSDVSFFALDGGAGVDREKLRLQVHDIDVTDHPYTTILPIIYRIL